MLCRVVVLLRSRECWCSCAVLCKLWYGMLWYGRVWYGMVLCGSTALFGMDGSMVRHGIVI